MAQLAPTLREAARFSRRLAGLVVDHLRPLPRDQGNPPGVALVHQGRCGSTVLGFLLDQHPRIYWDGEALLFHRVSERWLRQVQGTRGESGLRDLEILMRYARGRTYTLSAKGQFGYASSRLLVDDLRTLGFRHFVVLERKNTLRRVVSAVVGVQHKVWMLPRGRTPSLRPVQIPLVFPNGESLEERIRTLRNWYREARSVLADLPTLELTYEAHVLNDPRVAYRAVCDFLELDAVPVRIRFDRVNPFSLSDIVANYDEVADALRCTEFEWMLTR